MVPDSICFYYQFSLILNRTQTPLKLKTGKCEWKNIHIAYWGIVFLENNKKPMMEFWGIEIEPRILRLGDKSNTQLASLREIKNLIDDIYKLVPILRELHAV